jgi:hypothetical protein
VHVTVAGAAFERVEENRGRFTVTRGGETHEGPTVRPTVLEPLTEHDGGGMPNRQGDDMVSRTRD